MLYVYIYTYITPISENTQSTVGITTKNIESTGKMCILGFMKFLDYITDIVCSKCTQDNVNHNRKKAAFFERKSIPTLNCITVLRKWKLNFFA